MAAAAPAFVWLPSVLPDAEETGRSLVEAAALLAWLPLVGAGSEIARIRLEWRVQQTRAERQAALRRESEERLRIARELHDALAHNISLIGVQSGVALHLLDACPEHARPALQAINEASEDALRDLRSALDFLSRGLGESGGEAWAPRAPAAGVGDVPGLVGRTRAAGLDVRLTVAGPQRPLPIDVDLAAFRIVQEALTNVVRHAGTGASARVRLGYSPAELMVQIDDDGSGTDALAGSLPFESSVGRGITGDAPAGSRPGRQARRRTVCWRGISCPGCAPSARRGGMIRVLLADDQALVRAGFRALLDAQSDIEVVDEAGDGDEAVQLARRHRPDVVFMDIRTPGTDGLAATRTITADAQLADVQIVILTTFELDEYVFEALRSRASGFIVKNTSSCCRPFELSPPATPCCRRVSRAG